GRGRDEDALAFLRDAPEFVNLTLAEQPNGDFGHTIVRQWLIDAWQLEIYQGLLVSADSRLGAIAAKALKETRYHHRFSSGWLIRLGDGTPESHDRVQAALGSLWRFTAELFAADEVDERMQAAAARVQAVRALLAEVADPEIPVLSIVDLGVVRHVRFEGDGRLHVGITPTYSGCPATEVIRTAVRTALDVSGHADAVLEEVL